MSSGRPVNELGPPLARIVAGHDDRRLVVELASVRDLRCHGSTSVGLVDGAELGRERRRPVDHARVEFQPLRLVESDRAGDPAPEPVHRDELAVGG